ncbi:CpaF family protein [Eubacterium xylanophilum]|uniref:CpaF family protein n=1 Tax=Eubacterium xylanophilum TaxID=39497 RepID=UPI00047A2FDF|nr:CpaF family protein [Eubacterium xylanophilum]
MVDDELKEIQARVRDKVLSRISVEELDNSELRLLIADCIYEDHAGRQIRYKKKRLLINLLLNSMRKLDVLQELLEDDEVTEVMVNGKDDIFIERAGVISQTNLKFESRERLADIVQQIASGGNRIVNESNPILDVRLGDGSRINIVLDPIAIDGPVITIRKFPKEPMTMNKLMDIGAITEEAAEFLCALVRSKHNIFISGGTGAGKTTFLNILSNYIPEDERIITIEDSAELQIRNIPNIVRLEARNANVEGDNAISIRDLIKSALRMRPDRIVVGEIRDATAIDMLAAMNTGHDGSLSTGHANSPADMISRMETLVLMGMDIPIAAVRQQISSAIDYIIHLGRLRDKSRKVLDISEVGAVVDGRVLLNTIYSFEEEGEKNGKILGRLQRTDNNIINREKFLRSGIKNY